jgi:hypothetical protein
VEATRGLTDKQAMALTGLTRSTLQKIRWGEITGIGKLVQFAKGLDKDPEPFIAAAVEVTGEHDPFDVIGYMLDRELGLEPKDCLEVRRVIDDIIQRRQNRDSEQSAA